MQSECVFKQSSGIEECEVGRTEEAKNCAEEGNCFDCLQASQTNTHMAMDLFSQMV